jgi:hypothetical protein
MKKSILSILSISVFSFLLFTFVLQSCKKPRCPEDPCKNPQTVVAVEQDYYYWGQFKCTNADNSEIYLNATNWNEYASRVVPGRKYKIGYQEVACKERGTEELNDSETFTGIREGGCMLFPKKCIIIKCLEEIPMTPGSGCLDTELSALNFDDLNSSAISSKGVTGSSLNATVSFSGCSSDAVENFKLYGKELRELSDRGTHIWLVKAVNTFQGNTCQAYFEQNACFDLTSIKELYKNLNLLNEKEVIIRLIIGSETQDFIYTF